MKGKKEKRKSSLWMKKKMKTGIGVTFLFAASLLMVFLVDGSNTTQASPGGGTLLEDWFGVTLALIPPHDGGLYNSFDWDPVTKTGCFEPTKHVSTVSWDVFDWYGNWNFDDWHTTDVWGEAPSGGEWYDVEAIYIDNDVNNIYIAIVTSCPHYYDWSSVFPGGKVGVGINEPRWAISNNWIRPGDLCINLGLDPRDEKGTTTWSYDYGIDIVHDNRDIKDSYGNVYMRDNNLGYKVYRTKADPGGSDITDPGPGYDWYTANYHIEASWEHTNFDPFSSRKSPMLTYVGDAIVNYYEYDFGGELENNASTFVIEVTLPRSLLGENNPGPGDTIGVQWITGCRNEGVEAASISHVFPGQIGDYVWVDANQDGCQNDGPTGVPNVLVTLYNATSGLPIDSTWTDTNGYYNFSAFPGSYFVEFTLPPGYGFTSKNACPGGYMLDSDADQITGRTDPFILGVGEDNLTLDAGVYELASIGDRVWYDTDADGEQDGGEPGIDGVVVKLERSGYGEIASTTTSGGGYYLFDNLVPDDYRVHFVLKSGHVFSPKDAAGDSVDSDADVVSGYTDWTTLSAGENDMTWDCGMYELASIGDRVWEDINENGLQDDEPGIAGVIVHLYDSGGLVASTATNGTGYYLFDNLVPGDYYLVFELPVGYLFTMQDQGIDDGLDSDANTTTGATIFTTLSSGENDMTWDAGMVKEKVKKFVPPPYYDEYGNEYVTNITKIYLNFTDGDLNKTFFRIWKWNNSLSEWMLLFDWIDAYTASLHDPPFYPINLCEIGKHFNLSCCGLYEIEYYYNIDYYSSGPNPIIHIPCPVIYWNDVCVDCEPPETTKTYGEPNIPDYMQCELVHWITSDTTICLDADDGCCGSGINETWYKIYYENGTLVTIPDRPDCWTLYTGCFTIDGPDGIYTIYYKSIDNVGHVEEERKQKVILDNTPPLGDKTTVWISPPKQTVSNSQTFDVFINITPVVEIKAIQCDLLFSPALVTVNAVYNGSMFPVFGNFTINNDIGEIIGIVGSFTEGNSSNANGTLAVINLTANATHTGTTFLNIVNVIVLDANDTPIPVIIQDGKIIVSGTPPGNPWDLNDDGVVDMSDVMMIITHWGETGAPGWIPEDLSGIEGVPDGKINIFDIVAVTDHWG